ncbi:arginyltransferase [Porticoccus sp. GXU_MW_L64]
MSRDISPDVSTIRLFLTEPHPCSYLKNRSATTAFVDPSLPLTAPVYDRLTDSGFRRSGKYLYIPHCQSCSACQPSRIPVAAFKPNRQQRRCIRDNADLEITLASSVDHDEHFMLYSDYICLRHADGDMYPPTRSQYDDFIASPFAFTRYLEFRYQGKLVACSLVDILDRGISAIYTYYDPKAERRSLGTMAILTAVEESRRRNLPYVYLGYWIADCQKMRYKTRFKPVEILSEGNWQPHSDKNTKSGG